jgi:hypothetical protein
MRHMLFRTKSVDTADREHLYLSVFPEMNYKSIQTCITYDPPGPYIPGITFNVCNTIVSYAAFHLLINNPTDACPSFDIIYSVI